MGRVRDDGSQQSMWVATADLPQSAGHPFYERLNRILEAAGFDALVEGLCAPFYAVMGRPSPAPGRYFRLLLIGYFEGLDSERGIAWRAEDSLSMRAFLRLAAPAAPPDHSTISRTRRLFPVETHQAVFTWVLEQLAGAGLVAGKTLGVDATTLAANAAMRSIVRRDTGGDYTAFLTRLAKASGIETPTAEELARFDRKRKKKTSNQDWTHPHDPDAKVAKMKDGSTHLAHKVEHAVDLETGAVVGVTIQGADKGDTATMAETLVTATEQVETVLPEAAGVAEVVADKGYHSNETMVDPAAGFGAILRSRTGAGGAGRTRRRLGTRCMGTGAGSGASGAGVCCGVVASWLSVRLRTCLRPAGCAGCTFAVRGRSCAASGLGRTRPKNVSYSGRNRRNPADPSRFRAPPASAGALRSFCHGLFGAFEHSEAPAGSRRGPQPRAASASGDRRRHAPRPAGRGGIRRLRADRVVCGPVERSGAALDAIPAPFGTGRRTIEPSAPSASYLNTGDFYLGLLREGIRHEP